MSKIRKKLLFILFMGLVSMQYLQAQEKIRFDVSFPDYQAHYADVQMTITNIDTETIFVKIPVWTPGSYKVRDFAKSIEHFSVQDFANKSLEFNKIDKNTWRIETDRRMDVRVKYRVYCNERSVRTSLIDSSHAFLSPPTIFMYLDNKLNLGATVRIHLPKEWKVISTALSKVEGEKNTFFAKDFNLLYDTPLEIGNHPVYDFTVDGKLHQMAMYGGGNYDIERIKKDVSAIIRQETAVFGSVPNEYYLFIVHNYDRYGGGLEHLNSTVLGASRDKYTDETYYRNFLSLVAHEYFHLWNVKRLRPSPLGNFDYSKENYTTGLWIAEGFTAYYDNLLVYRAGLMNKTEYFKLLADDISKLRNTPAYKEESLKDASFDAWIKYYQPNENSVNSNISYYLKGSLVALIMDMEIIRKSKGKYKLDDVMKAAYEKFYLLENRPYKDEEFIDLVFKTTKVDVKDLYEKYVLKAGDIPLEDYFKDFALVLKDKNKGANKPYLGVKVRSENGKVIVKSVLRDSPAWKEGLNVGDEIISVNSNRVTGTDILEGLAPNDSVEIQYSRDNIVKHLTVTLDKDVTKHYVLEEDAKARSKSQKCQSIWLESK